MFCTAKGELWLECTVMLSGCTEWLQAYNVLHLPCCARPVL